MRTGFVGLVAVAFLGLSPGCQSRTAPIPGVSNIKMPDQEARDFTLTETSEGKKNWTLWASYAAMYNDRNLVDAKTIQEGRFEIFEDRARQYLAVIAKARAA